jgi:branched-subunit amino acid aminotransferase/4-amino-4-deoxychorismate lyase
MIWTGGDVIPAEALRISVLDRTFEHGLGLFETFRTWNGHATLLPRHLERMGRSAGELGLSLESCALPDEEAILRLRAAGGFLGGEDSRIRITLSGGLTSRSANGHGATLWMAAGPLPPPPMMSGGVRVVGSMLVDPDDPLARHKTLNYWRRRIEQSRPGLDPTDEVLCVTPDRQVCEGTRSNIFLVADGRLITPGTDGPLLDGIMRRLVIDLARADGIGVVEGPVSLDMIAMADESFLTNSVRGIVPVSRLLHVDLAAPGPVTRRVWDEVFPWLVSGGSTP